MSAIETLPELLAPPAADRRGAPRHRMRDTLPVILGRAEGTIVDISATGARVRHDTAVRLGTDARLSFEWERRRFAATARILGSRIVALGAIDVASPLFETRVRFVHLSDESAETLVWFLQTLTDRDLRRWVANLRGWYPESTVARSEVAYYRCVPFFGRWERKWTRDARQPEEGFTIPSSIDENELSLLFRLWTNSDDDGREVLRQMARASVESVR